MEKNGKGNDRKERQGKLMGKELIEVEKKAKGDTRMGIER